MVRTLLAGSMVAAALLASGVAQAQAPHTSAAAQPYPRQGNLQDALRSVENAQGALTRAQNDKSGHREKALQLTTQAVAEIKAALQEQYGR